jgi:hypothetical protein
MRTNFFSLIHFNPNPTGGSGTDNVSQTTLTGVPVVIPPTEEPKTETPVATTDATPSTDPVIEPKTETPAQGTDGTPEIPKTEASFVIEGLTLEDTTEPSPAEPAQTVVFDSSPFKAYADKYGAKIESAADVAALFDKFETEKAALLQEKESITTKVPKDPLLAIVTKMTNEEGANLEDIKAFLFAEEYANQYSAKRKYIDEDTGGEFEDYFISDDDVLFDYLKALYPQMADSKIEAHIESGYASDFQKEAEATKGREYLANRARERFQSQFEERKKLYGVEVAATEEYLAEKKKYDEAQVAVEKQNAEERTALYNAFATPLDYGTPEAPMKVQVGNSHLTLEKSLTSKGKEMFKLLKENNVNAANTFLQLLFTDEAGQQRKDAYDVINKVLMQFSPHIRQDIKEGIAKHLKANIGKEVVQGLSKQTQNIQNQTSGGGSEGMNNGSDKEFRIFSPKELEDRLKTKTK